MYHVSTAPVMIQLVKRICIQCSGISQVKSAPVRAFQSSYRGGRHMINSRDSEKMHMTSIQTIANSLLEVVEVSTANKPMYITHSSSFLLVTQWLVHVIRSCCV